MPPSNASRSNPGWRQERRTDGIGPDAVPSSSNEDGDGFHRHQPQRREVEAARHVGPGRYLGLQHTPRVVASLHLAAWSVIIFISVQADIARVGHASASTVAVVSAYTIFVGAACAWNRTYTEVDSHGITVVNVFRTHRVRWIDLVQVDGRPAITLLTKARRITYWTLTQRPDDPPPWSRLGRRRCLDATADWMRHMSVAQRSSGDRAADYRRN